MTTDLPYLTRRAQLVRRGTRFPISVLLTVCVLIFVIRSPAAASIIFTQPAEPIHAGIFPDEPDAEIDLDWDGEVDVIIPGSNRAIDVYPQGNNRVLSTEVVGGFFAVDLSEGSFIGADPGVEQVWRADSPVMAACFNAGGSFCFGNFLGGIEFLGTEFQIAGNTHYGWLEIQSREDIPFIDVLSWGYESEPGMGILAGAIPEPSAAVMLLTASLLLIHRRK